MSAFIYVQTRFNGVHCWSDIPDSHPMQFLKNPHRHEFHVKAVWRVSHHNRDLEFLHLKDQLDNFISTELFSFDNPIRYAHTHTIVELGNKSCEDIAQAILDTFNCHSVEVSEDGENGAIVVGGGQYEYS